MLGGIKLADIAATPKTDDGHAPVIRFELSGVSRAFDPARQAIRPDLADIAEAATHFAPHYAAPVMMTVMRATALRDSNAPDANAIKDLNPPAQFAMLDCTGGWAWGFTADDHRVGYVLGDDLVGTDATAE